MAFICGALWALALLPSAQSLQMDVQWGVEPTDVELVVAAYAENVSFIEPLVARVQPAARVRLYCKGEQIRDARCERLSNVGTEEFAYLTHILQNWDRLAPVTVFTPASIYSSSFRHSRCRKLAYALNAVATPERRANFTGYAAMSHTAVGSWIPFGRNYSIGSYRTHYGGEKEQLCRASEIGLQKWFERFVGAGFVDNALRVGVTYNAIFAVSAERIRRHPKTVYEGLLSEVTRCAGNAFEAGHYIERSWKAMFADPGDNATDLPADCPAAITTRRPAAGAR